MPNITDFVSAPGSAAAGGLAETLGDNKVWESCADVVDFWLVAVLPMDVLSFDSTGEVELDLTGGAAAK